MGADSIMKFVVKGLPLLIPGLVLVFCYCCSGSGESGVKMMKAPGRDDQMARPLFESDPKGYFRDLRADRKRVG